MSRFFFILTSLQIFIFRLNFVDLVGSGWWLMPAIRHIGILKNNSKTLFVVILNIEENYEPIVLA